MIYLFGEFACDDALYELRHRDQRVEIEPKVFDMLAYLLHHHERVVTRQELLEELWPGEHVSEASLSTCIKAARRAVHDDGTRQTVIATLHGRGYRFVAPVTLGAGSPATPPVRRQHPQIGGSVAPETFAPPLFVGRERELAELYSALEAALSGRGQLVMLVGEPGIGKTRTAEQLAARARHRNAEVLVGRCHESEGAPAFWPWVQLFRAYLRERDTAAIAAAMGAGAADIGQIVPEVGERFPDLAPPPALEPEQARFRLFDSVTTFLRNVTKRQALLLVLDDLHWADKPSLLLLQFVARQMDDTRLLVVGTYRDADFGRQHALTQTLGELARARSCRRIPLHGLTEMDVASVIAHATGTAAPGSLVAAVHRESDGNPFFVTEIVRLLTDTGVDDSTGALATKLTIPQTVREAIGRHLDPLSTACNRVLQHAAVIGREFDLNTVSRVDLPSPESKSEHLLAAIDEACAARIIEPLPPAVGRFRFTHALIREAIYDALGTAERVQLHRRAGEAIEHLHRANVTPYLPVLAHHFFRAAAAGSRRKAIDYAKRAAQWAMSQLAYEAAVTHYESALRLLEGSAADAAEHCELLLALGNSQWRAHETSHARQTLQRAAATARHAGAAEQFAQAALGFGGDALRGFEVGIVDPELVDLLEEALRLLGPADSALRARVLARLAVALYHEPDSLERRAALSQQAVEMAGRDDDPAARLAVLYSRHWAIWSPDSLEDRLGAATQMVQLAMQLKDREMALHAHRFHFMDLMEDGAIAAADIELETCARLADELRQPYYLWYVRTFKSLRTFLEGRFDESERLAQEAASIGQRANNQNVSQIFAMQLFALRREQGRMAELEAPTRALVSQYPTLPAWRAALAVICGETGNLDDAAEQMEQLATRQFASLPRDTFWLAAIGGLADVCATLDDTHHAPLLYRLLAPYAGRNVMMAPGAACSGSAARPLGRLASTMGRWETAGSHFEAALEQHRQFNAPHFIAHTQRDYAEMLLRRAEIGDQQQALALLAECSATYAALHMPSHSEKARALGRRADELADDRASTASRRPRARVTALRSR